MLATANRIFIQLKILTAVLSGDEAATEFDEGQSTETPRRDDSGDAFTTVHA